MVIVMKPHVTQQAIEAMVRQLEQDYKVQVGVTNGVDCSILGLVGDTSVVD